MKIRIHIESIFQAEKKRIIFLYNQTLKKRVTYLNYRLDIVKKQASEKKVPVNFHNLNSQNNLNED